MTTGSVLAAGSVLLWARVDSILALYLTFTVTSCSCGGGPPTRAGNATGLAGS